MSMMMIIMMMSMMMMMLSISMSLMIYDDDNDHNELTTIVGNSKVTVINGLASFAGPDKVEVDGTYCSIYTIKNKWMNVHWFA